MASSISTTKEVEVSFEELEVEEESPKLIDALYRITIALKPGQVTLTQIITPFRCPFPTVTLVCDNIHAKAKVVEINGQVVRIRSFLPPKANQCSAVLLVKAVEGLQARRIPL